MQGAKSFSVQYLFSVQVYWTLKRPGKSFREEETKLAREEKSLFRQRKLIHAKAGQKGFCCPGELKERLRESS